MYNQTNLNTMKKIILLIVFGITVNVYGQDDMLCMGHHLTEDEANLMMKKFAASWNTPRIEYPYIQKVYALYDAEHRVANVYLATEKHDCGYSKRVAMYNFMAHHLGLNNGAIPYNNGYREDFVTLRSQEQLKVFSVEHPIASEAQKGNEAVVKYLKLDERLRYPAN
jgi:hypothetical protein